MGKYSCDVGCSYVNSEEQHQLVSCFCSCPNRLRRRVMLILLVVGGMWFFKVVVGGMFNVVVVVMGCCEAVRRGINLLHNSHS